MGYDNLHSVLYTIFSLKKRLVLPAVGLSISLATPQQLLNWYTNFRCVQGIKGRLFFSENWSLGRIKRSKLVLTLRQK